ncbi:MAG TPA: AI-2E family transporter [Candidatus Dormibacteraeota bacterium]|nr:AI-2E family transporter [Candidatus Dormibacteraeota bacterium]
MHDLNWGRLRDQCLVGLSLIAFLWVASQVIGRVLHIVVVVILALVLAYALEPPLAWASRILPRGLAALLIYAMALGLIAAGVLLIGPPAIEQSESLAQKLPAYFDQLSSYQPFFGIDLAGSVRGVVQSAFASAFEVVTAIAGAVVDAVLVLVLGFWFMVDGGRMRDLPTRFFPEQQRDKVRFVEDTVSQVLGAYIRGQLVMAAIIGVSSGLGSWLLGVRYPVLIGILAFFFELIPMAGPILASLPAVMISLTQPFPLVIYVIVFFVVMQVIENNVLAPRITGGAVGLHPVIALLAIVIGADLGGVVGALFAVPFAGIASVLIAALWKGWHGEPVVIERVGMRFRLPRKRVTA